MLYSKGPSGEFDRSAFVEANRQQLAVGRRLPENMVKDLTSEVIRRLAERHAKPRPDDVEVSPERLETLCHALIRENEKHCLRLVEDLRDEGASLSTVYLSYLAAAARVLGEWWASDKASFTEVTVASGRIYAIIRAMRPALSVSGAIQRRSATFAVVPGEQHVLGVSIATNMFRAKGWAVDLCTAESHDELVEEIGNSDVPFIGLTASGTQSSMALVRLVVALRVSRPDAFILIGGHIADEDLGLVDISGADFVTADLQVAFDEMERVVTAR